ncbi:pectinesterase inhibitor-like [Coffea eugenioides]|uniref:pectinesterase inhibitor-like n=1 Tax=Coffea eugenioides TaxID=49369 RepID=UPI000F615CBF|nr:pectinesterase inhibitor-like [Coffea eugenioides]
MAAPYLQNVSGDAALITKVCSRTPQFDYCYVCIQGDATRDKEDVKGLARQSITCSGIQTLYVYNDFDNLLKNATDPTFKKTCILCKEFILGALYNVGEARQSFRDGDYKDASIRLEVSIANYNRCDEAIKKVCPPISQELRMNLDKVKGFYEVAIAILFQI